MDDLKPCPFCGGQPVRKDVNFWTGMRNDLIRVEFHHHCATPQRQRAYICISGVTEPEAVEAWNQRHPAALQENRDV